MWWPLTLREHLSISKASNHSPYLTVLIVKSAHDKVCHNGTKETLTEVRSSLGSGSSREDPW